MANKKDIKLCRALVRDLYSFKDETIKRYVENEPVWQMKKRPSSEELAVRYRMQRHLVMKIRNGTATCWNELRAEGIAPDYWKLRPTEYGTLKHLCQCFEAEYAWRYKNGYINNKVRVNERSDFMAVVRRLSTMYQKSRAYRWQLQQAYVSLRGWTTEQGEMRLKNRLDGVAGANRKPRKSKKKGKKHDKKQKA